jgi:hypothetical protein
VPLGGDRRESCDGSFAVAGDVEERDEAVCAGEEMGSGCGPDEGGGRLVGFCCR